MNAGVISRYVGIALICNAFFMLLSAVISALYGFDSSFSPLLVSCFLTFLFGVFPLIFVTGGRDINIREGLAILLLAWFLSCIFGMLPYVLWGGEFNLVNAWFESASGYTTTGATILNEIETLPHGLLFWRSSTHFIGGLGVVVFIIMFLPTVGMIGFRMSKMEVMDVSRSNFRYRFKKLIRIFVTVYLVITVISFAALVLAGMSPFDAINHAFSAVATGGFSTRNLSIAAFDSPLIEFILILSMVLSSIHFGVIYASFATRSAKIFKDPVTRFYLMTILISTVIVAITLLLEGVEQGIFHALRNGAFAVVSTISTTGFSISDTSGWPILAIMVILYVSVQCGCSGSTCGGVRSDRMWLILKGVRAQLIKMAHPNAVVQVKSGGQVIEKDLISSVHTFLFIYLVLTFLGSLFYAMTGMSMMESVSSSISMMGNMGLAFGENNSFYNFANAPQISKIVMGIQMIVGRLSLYPVLLIFTLFRKRF
ncbi:MAG TPA: TrkH family potassium uptake protein [Bacteroidales bacterium]|jgi:trk system potassium uptake protein TrkH|nr:TrkH family potassium uptake protein [Bacteroidales bacterium]